MLLKCTGTHKRPPVLAAFLLFFIFLGANACKTPRLYRSNAQAISFKELAQTTPYTVVIFLAAECPISQKYVLSINQLAKAFPQVQFVGVFPKWDDLPSIRGFGSVYACDFPLFSDAKNQLVRRLGAEITPEAFLMAGDQMLYRGAIDNWFYALGQYRDTPTEFHLKNALMAVLQGEKIAQTRTRSVGCKIER